MFTNRVTSKIPLPGKFIARSLADGTPMGGQTYKNSLDLIRVRIDFLTDHDRQWMLRKTAQRMFFA